MLAQHAIYCTTSTTTTTTLARKTTFTTVCCGFCSVLVWFGFVVVWLQSGEMRSSPKEIGAFNENGRNFVATKDTSRDFSNSQDNTDRGSMSDQAFACSASSVESLPSASGSSKYKAAISFTLCLSSSLSIFLYVCVCVCTT